VSNAEPTPEPNPELVPAEYNAFIEAVELDGVDVVDLAATRHALGQADSATFEVDGGHQVADGALFVRFEVRAAATKESGDAVESVADLKVALVLRFAIGGEVPPDTVLQRFLATTANLVAQPYLRENLYALSNRLGLEGITLPLAKARATSED
jgi:hypothetical protein